MENLEQLSMVPLEGDLIIDYDFASVFGEDVGPYHRRKAFEYRRWRKSTEGQMKRWGAYFLDEVYPRFLSIPTGSNKRSYAPGFNECIELAYGENTRTVYRWMQLVRKEREAAHLLTSFVESNIVDAEIDGVIHDASYDASSEVTPDDSKLKEAERKAIDAEIELARVQQELLLAKREAEEKLEDEKTRLEKEKERAISDALVESDKQHQKAIEEQMSLLLQLQGEEEIAEAHNHLKDLQAAKEKLAASIRRDVEKEYKKTLDEKKADLEAKHHKREEEVRLKSLISYRELVSSATAYMGQAQTVLLSLASTGMVQGSLWLSQEELGSLIFDMQTTKKIIDEVMDKIRRTVESGEIRSIENG